MSGAFTVTGLGIGLSIIAFLGEKLFTHVLERMKEKRTDIA